jgi:outer membrane protein
MFHYQKNLFFKGAIVTSSRRLSLLCGLFYSFSTQAVDFQTIYQWAVMQDPTFAAADANRLSTREAYPQALANLLPNLSGTATEERATSSNSASTTTSFARMKNQSISLQQPLINVAHWTKLQQSLHTRTQAESTFEAARQDLIMRVATQYFSILKAQDALTFATSQRRAFMHQLEQTKQRFEVGIVAITDVYDAQASLDNSIALVVSAHNDLANEYEKMRQITGSPVEEVAQVSDELPLLSPDPNDEEAWIDMAEQNNPALQASREIRNIAKSNVWTQRSGHLPTLTAFAQLNHETTTPGGLSIDGTSKIYGVSANWNLISGGSVLSLTRQARADYLAADQKYEALYRQTISQTHQAYRGMLTGSQEVRSLKQAVLSNQSALDATQAAYDVGTRTIVDVLTAETNLLQAQQNYAAARYNMILQYLTLKQQSGILSPSDVLEVNQWLVS